MRWYARLSLHLLLTLLPLSLSLSQLPETQKTAMEKISRFINTTTDMWNTSDPDPCKWPRVNCTQNNITRLSLSSLKLSSSNFLQDLCSLSTLRSVDLSNNQLSSIDPAFFSNCTAAASFQSLNFSSNMLKGSLPAFAGFSSLESLDLSSNFLVGSINTQLGELTALRSLNLSNNKFSGAIPTLLGKGMALEEMQLSKNKFKGPIPYDVAVYRNLTLVDLSTNELKGRIPDQLTQLPKLEFLVLSGNNLVGGIPQNLSRMVTLSRFAANQNHLSGSIPAGISNNVKNLDLSFNNLTGFLTPDLLSGPNLVFVDLSSNALEGPVPVNISRSLFRLRLGQNRFDGSIPTSIGNVSDLVYFEAYGNRLSGEIPEELAMCEKLTLLDLRGNQLQGQLRDWITKLTQLVVLKLDGNQLNGEIPSEFSQFKNLSILSLGRNSLTGSIPREVTQLTKLSTLNLESNQLSGRIPDGFGDMKGLLEVRLGNNRLNGTIPKMPESLQISLNLSRNLFHGPLLAASLGLLTGLEVLDLSYNQFNGSIPDFLTSLTSLTQLNLFNNQFSGSVPNFRTNLNLNISGNPGIIQPKRTVSRKGKNVANVVIVAVVVGSVAAVISLAVFCIISRRFYRINDEISEEEEGGPQVIIGHTITTGSIHRSAIDFSKAVEAAGNPANAIFKSRFSTYYKAVMPSGVSYCIKKLNWSDKIFQLGSQERFGQEVEALGRLNNSRIMGPVAYVLTADSAYLFYDHVHKGTLFDLLHKNLGGAALDWQSRYNIALGVAHGIAFLHGCGDPVLLLDLSTKTIVLNSANEPQIADIELCKVIDPSKSTGSISTVAGSVGYIPPEYAYTMRVTMAGNIYSFGVVMLELLTGKPSVSEGTELAKWVMSNSTRNESLVQILDPTISKTSLAVRSRMLSVLKIALACVSVSPESRPKIKSVLRMLLNAR